MSDFFRILVFDDGKTIYPAIAELLGKHPRLDIRLAPHINNLMINLDELQPHAVVVNAKLSSFESLTALALTKRKKPSAPYILFYDSTHSIREFREGQNIVPDNPALTKLIADIENIITEKTQQRFSSASASLLNEAESITANMELISTALADRERLLDSLESLVIEVSMDEHITYCNKRALELVGKRFEQVVQKQFEEVFPIVFHHTSLFEMKSVLFSEGAWRGELYLKDKDGEQHLFEAVSRVLRRYEEPVSGIVFILSEKQADAFAGYQNIIEGIEDGICVLNSSGIITFTNGAFTQMLGFSDGELHEQWLLAQIKEENRNAFREKCDDILGFSESCNRLDVEMLHKNGINRVYCELKIALLRIEGDNNLLVIARDITEAKLREMFDEKGTRKPSIADSIAELQNTRSHDFHTYLNAIMGFADILKEQAKESGAEGQNLSVYAEQIYLSGEKMLGLVNRARKEEEPLPGEDEDTEQSFDLEPFLNQCLSELEEKASQKNIRVNFLAPVQIRTVGSPRFLKLVFKRLLESSISLMEGGAITIDTGFDSLKHLVFVRLKDMSAGIEDILLAKILSGDPKDRDKIPDEYLEMADTITYTKQALASMKARLDTFSQRGKGTVHTVYLQPDEQTREKFEQKSSIFYTVSPELIYLNDLYPHLLVIEDDPGSSKMLEVTLKPISKLELAQNGHDAIRIIEEHSTKGIAFDLVLLDIGLPDPWDGITLRKHLISTYPVYKKIPFLAETAFVGRQEKERIIESGFDGFISKPIDRRFLIKTLASTLKRSRGETNGS